MCQRELAPSSKSQDCIQINAYCISDFIYLATAIELGQIMMLQITNNSVTLKCLLKYVKVDST